MQVLTMSGVVKKNGKGLGDQIRDKSTQLQQAFNVSLQECSLLMCNAIINGTPVDTGALRANWFPSFESVTHQTIDYDGAAGAAQVSYERAQQAIGDFTMGKRFFFSNSLPYAAVVEYGMYPDPPANPGKNADGETKTVGGFSRQAPAGMVRLNVEKFREAFPGAVKLNFKESKV
jgi:hypothetical protein